MSYLNLIGLPRGVSTRTFTRPVSLSVGGMRKSEDTRAADRTAISWLLPEGFFRGTKGLCLRRLRLAGERLPGQQERQGPRGLGRAAVELRARQGARLDLDGGAGAAGQEVSEELAEVGHVADEERARELSPLDLLQDLLRIGPRGERLGLDQPLAAVGRPRHGLRR